MTRGSYSGGDSGTVIWAVGWDLILGDSPEEADPAALAANAADAVALRAPQNSQTARAIYGTVASVGLPFLASKVTRWLLSTTARVNLTLSREIATTLLKSTISIRSTLHALSDVRDSIDAQAVPVLASDQAQESLPVVEATVTTAESLEVSRTIHRVGDDLTGNLVGPLFYFVLMGVPGAVAYRVSRVVAERWSQKPSDPLARAARRVLAVMSFVPSMLSGLLVAGAARLTERRGAESWDASRGASRSRPWTRPGWEDGAFAGALDVQIDTGRGDLVNAHGRLPTAADLPRVRRLFLVSAAGAILGGLLVAGVRTSTVRRRG